MLNIQKSGFKCAYSCFVKTNTTQAAWSE